MRPISQVSIPMLLLLCLVTAGCQEFSGLRKLGPETSFWNRTATLRPTFAWEAFPRERDRKQFGPDMQSRISNVTYELGIFSYSDSPPYSRSEDRRISGLHEPRYTPPTPLEPNTGYSWEVRAHFFLDGQPRLTQWSRYLGFNTPNEPDADER